MIYDSDFISQMTVSTFGSCDTRKVVDNRKLSDFFAVFEDPRMKPVIDSLRSLPYKSEEYNNRKRHIPCATISCACYEIRGREYVISRNPIICIDIDLADNPKLEDDDFRKAFMAALLKYPCTYAVGTSCSGRGVFLIMALASNDSQDEFEDYFRAIEDEFKKNGVIIDKNCKDVTRLRIASCEKVSVKSGKIEGYSKKIKAPEPELKPITRKNNLFTTDEGFLEELVETVIEAGYAPETYEEWLKCAFVLRPLGSTGLRLFDRVSSNASTYMGLSDVQKKFSEVSNSTCTVNDACGFFCSIAKSLIGPGYWYRVQSRIIKKMKNNRKSVI